MDYEKEIKFIKQLRDNAVSEMHELNNRIRGLNKFMVELEETRDKKKDGLK